MKLAALLDADITVPAECREIEIAHLASDSREAGPGTLFAALAGSKADGAQFARDAVTRGAVAILAGEGVALPELAVPVLRAKDPRRALALMAARFYRPQPEHIVAVTGTSGKTSVAEFTRQILAHCGKKAASLGTIGVVKPDGAIYGSLTTPDPVMLHRTLAELAAEGVTHLAMEASSHGLDQRRLDGVRLTAGAFLNLGHDHLDYHGTPSIYLAAKMRLFRVLLRRGQPVVIAADGGDSGSAHRIARECGLRAIVTGIDATRLADGSAELVRLISLERAGYRQRATVDHGGHKVDLDIPLIGAYQVSNALVAAALASCTGVAMADALAALPHLRTVSGRLDVVGERNGAFVVVDYAHKPDALAAALDALRPFATGRLICVFGCGGDRDKGKRPIMGRIAVEKANVVIVTDDNPRSESPEQIRREIWQTVRPGDGQSGTFDTYNIGDRAEAIAKAIAMMQPGDVVLIAGKGHETGQIVGSVTHPFSDHAVARAALGKA